MNSVIAQGAEGSLIRKFQDNPELGVELLEALQNIVGENSKEEQATWDATSHLGIARDKIAKAEGRS